MRCAMIAVFCLAVATSVHAQDATVPACQPVSSPARVVMTMADGERVRGTLLCLGEQEVMLARDGAVTRRSLSEVRRIDKPRDGVADGFLKGAAIGLIGWGVFCTGCDAEYMLRSTLGYALIGLSIDALQGNGKTIYTAGKSNAVQLRFRW